jgi:KUP system potassium uptake protein
VANHHHSINKVTAAGLLIALGIIYGDIGTSPLYVFSAVINGKPISELLILGAISCIFWTLTLQTTLKYVILTLQADNKGEGGIFSLYTLVRRQRKWLVFPAMLGGAALLADGMITPPISITSAIEGLRNIPALNEITESTIIIIVLAILCLLFFMQQFGTNSIGKMFGPIMSLWFLMLAVLGISYVVTDFAVLKAFNPYYAIKLLTQYPSGFWILGAIFLCTTGAEALYSDLGHCGRENIRVSWIFVKIALVLQYFGQGAWLLAHQGDLLGVRKPIFELLPREFLFTGILIATAAAVIASQALISGSFTLISEAIRLNFWPRVRLVYPSDQKGQLYVPSINILLWMKHKI